MTNLIHLLVLAILAGTLILMLIRPGNRTEAWYACAGGIGMVLVGAVPPGAVPGLAGQTKNVLLFLAGMMLLTGVAERAGVFAELADGCVRLAHGNGRRLYILLFVLGALVTATLSLDVTVIMLTPIVATIAARRKLDPVPFLFACVFVANTASLVLPVSNLTNLLVFARLEPGFASFVGTMWLPNLVAAGVNLGIFLWLFRNRIPDRFDSDDLTPVALDRWLLTAGVITAATLVAIFVLGLADLPLWWAAIGGGGLLASVAATSGRLTVRQVRHDLSPGIFAFVIAMTVVVDGFRREFLAGRSIPIPHDQTLAALTGIAGGAIGSNIVNNIPMTVLALSIVDGVKPEMQQALAYGTLVGVNIGPALTTYGSLATMLWLTLVRRRGIAISTGDYLRVSLVTVPAVLVATGVTLIAVLLT
ncbi:MAG: ArsB/NhaD family transporter [Thermomicrobiales bacterium]